MDNGLSSEQARTLVKGSKPITKDGLVKINQKYNKWALTNPKRVKKASKIVDNVLSGKPLVKDGDKPTNNQILKVVQDIQDRVEPKITRQENLNINVDLSPIDLSKYKR